MAVGFAGLLILTRFVGLLSAALAAAALVYYVVVYTLVLKRHTHWSILIGSGVGALTPLIGWVAVTNRIDSVPFLLSAIIMLWTLPHFWTLALFRRNDYDRAGLSLLPPKGVSLWISIPSVLMVAATIFLAPAAKLGPVYFGLAAMLGTGFLYLALRTNLNPSSRAALRLYTYSIFYITLIFGAMILDRLIF